MHLGIRRLLTHHLSARSCDRDQFTQTCLFSVVFNCQVPVKEHSGFIHVVSGKVKGRHSQQMSFPAINKSAVWTQDSARNSNWGPSCGLHTPSNVWKCSDKFELQYTVRLEVWNEPVFFSVRSCCSQTESPSPLYFFPKIFRGVYTHTSFSEGFEQPVEGTLAS